MTAANLDVRPAIAPGSVAPNATNLVLVFAVDPIRFRRSGFFERLAGLDLIDTVRVTG
jgi:hypothetical protein